LYVSVLIPLVLQCQFTDDGTKTVNDWASLVEGRQRTPNRWTFTTVRDTTDSSAVVDLEEYLFPSIAFDQGLLRYYLAPFLNDYATGGESAAIIVQRDPFPRPGESRPQLTPALTIGIQSFVASSFSPQQPRYDCPVQESSIEVATSDGRSIAGVGDVISVSFSSRIAPSRVKLCGAYIFRTAPGETERSDFVQNIPQTFLYQTAVRPTLARGACDLQIYLNWDNGALVVYTRKEAITIGTKYATR